MALRASLATRGDAILCDLAAVNPRLLLQRSGRSVRIVQVTPVRCNFYSVRQVSTSGRSVRSALSRTLFRRSRWRCQACGRGGVLEVHHILKRAQGGSEYRRRHSIPSITSVALAPYLARGIAVIPVSTLIHNTKSGRSGAAWQPGPEIGDGLTEDREETVALSAIDAGSVFAPCVSPLVAPRNVPLTRWSRAPTVAPRGIVCVSPKPPRAFLAQHSKRSAEHVRRRETMSVRSRRETVQAEPEGTLAVIHALGISLGITLWTRSGGRRVVEPPRA